MNSCQQITNSRPTVFPILKEKLLVNCWSLVRQQHICWRSVGTPFCNLGLLNKVAGAFNTCNRNSENIPKVLHTKILENKTPAPS